MIHFITKSRLATTAGIVGMFFFHENYRSEILADSFLEPKLNESVSSKKKPIESTKKLMGKCRHTCRSVMYENGLPGLFIAVHKDGKLVWEQGLGYSDVENHVVAAPNSVLRIASISKSLTSTLVGKFIDEGKLHLEDKVSDYIPDYPYPQISIRQLLSHTSGIRHYEKKKTESEKKEKGKKKQEEEEESDIKEFLLNKKFKSVSESLDLFKNDELLCEPGEKYSYTTHGFTLLSAIIEEAEKKHLKKLKKDEQLKHVKFANLMKGMFKDLDLKNTYLDENDPIIYNRARFYVRDKNHKLKNSPYVDNSYKWAGGGFLSSVRDLCKFGDIVLYSFQHEGGYITQNTAKKLWSGVVKTNPDRSQNEYGLGWAVTPKYEICKMCRKDDFSVEHTGGAVGASSILFIRPSKNSNNSSEEKGEQVNGIVIAIITNMENVGLRELARKIAQLLDDTQNEVSEEKPNFF